MNEPTLTPPTQAGRGASSLDLALCAVLIALTLMIWAPLVRVGLNLSDEGWLVTAIDRVVAGERLYVDIYRSYAPGLYWFFAFLFRAFDADLVTIRWVWLGAHVLIGVGVYRLARLVSPAWIAFAAALVVIILRAPVQKTFVPFCYLGSLWLCHRLLARSLGVRGLCAIGVGFGLIGLFRQEAAAYGLLIGLVTLFAIRGEPDDPYGGFRERVVTGAWIGVGVAFVWLPIVAGLAFQGSIGSAFEQMVLAGARGNASMSLPFPDPLLLFAGPNRLWISFFLMPTIAAGLGLFLTARAWHRDPGSTEAILVGQWTLMALLGHSIFASRTDAPHLLQALIAPILILSYMGSLGWRATAENGGWPARVCAITIGLWMLVTVVMINDVAGRYTMRRDGAVMPVPGSDVIVPRLEAAMLERLVEEIETATEAHEPIFVAPYSPAIYHLTGRSNPTRHDAILPGYASDAIQAEIIDALERSATPLVVIEGIAWDGRRERTLPVFAPALTDYLSSHFVVHKRIGRFILSKRR